MEKFVASDVEGIGEHLVHFSLLVQLLPEETVRKLEYVCATLLAMEEEELPVYFKVKVRV